MGEVVILIPAGGAARRMGGRDKLLEPVDGTPVLARLAAAARATGCRVLVTLRPGDTARAAVLDGVELVGVADAAEGMAASLRAGIGMAGRAAGLMVLPGDMPELEADDLRAVLAAFAADPDRVIRAVDIDGQAGHPVVLPRRLFDSVAGLRGDQGARAAIAGEAVHSVPLPGHRATCDLDTPGAWADWRARTGR